MIGTASPLPEATEDSLYEVTIQATDADGDPLTFGLPAAPQGMSMDSSTGQIQWTPLGAQAGDHSLTVTVDDGHGPVVSRDYAIHVASVNDAPQITSMPPTSGTEGVGYVYPVQATDEDDTVLSFSLVGSPDGMTIAPDTGLISWTPSAVQAGAHAVTVQVTDPAGAFARQDYMIDVAEALNAPPVVTSTPVVTGAEGQSYLYDVEADDPDGDSLTYSVVTAPTGMAIQSATGVVE